MNILNLNLNNQEKIAWVKNLAIVSFLIMLIYAPKLWISTKDFPTIPLFDSLPALVYPIDYILAGVFFALLTVYFFTSKRRVGFSIVALYIILSFFDQNRLQPYFYQSILTLLFIALYKKSNEKAILFGIYAIFFATYFWSGIQKFNAEFYKQWLRALLKHFDFIPLPLLEAFTYAVPWLEMLIGLFLLSNKTRKLGVISIIGMHSTIVFLLFYLGYGYNVVFWNIQNMICVFILFWSLKTNIIQDFIAIKKLEFKKALIITFTFILPFSNIFGGWDHLLSFSFFSAKLDYYLIVIDPDLAHKLPQHIQKFYKTYQGKQFIYVQDWCTATNKLLFYPEDRCINYLNSYLKSFADDPNQPHLTELVIWNHQ